MDAEIGGRKLSAAGVSLYQQLGLGKGAGYDEIKKAYRRLALKYHPDKNPHDPIAAERIRDINYANSVLSEPTKRELYDAYGSLGLYIAEQVGEENVHSYFLLQNKWFKGLFIFCGVITGCYFGCCCCCCCCNFCFGKLRPRARGDEGEYGFLREDFDQSPGHDGPPANDDDSPETEQPWSSGGMAGQGRGSNFTPNDQQWRTTQPMPSQRPTIPLGSGGGANERTGLTGSGTGRVRYTDIQNT